MRDSESKESFRPRKSSRSSSFKRNNGDFEEKKHCHEPVIVNYERICLNNDSPMRAEHFSFTEASPCACNSPCRESPVRCHGNRRALMTQILVDKKDRKALYGRSSPPRTPFILTNENVEN